ncbi:receptor expression-enhancing protein 1 [Aphelenchoides avenae]|nr:receptor expression-enhancing protein 1 [Aphelenchus avenae]
MYWIVFALYCFAESIADIIISFWFPFYYELKVIFVLWLLSPWTRGASILYKKWIHPLFMKHEEDIDAFLEQAKSESYRQVVNLGSRGLMCARDIVATAALRGQAQLAQQIQRSYSLNDVSRNEVTGAVSRRTIRVTEIQEEEQDDEMQVRTWAGTYDERGRIVECKKEWMWTTVHPRTLTVQNDDAHGAHVPETALKRVATQENTTRCLGAALVELDNPRHNVFI